MNIPESVTPVVIFGRPRAGTRFMMSVLNSFPDVAIQPEIPPAVMASLTQLVDSVEEYYCKKAENGDERRRTQYDEWRRKKRLMIMQSWAYLGKDRETQKDLSKCLYYGYKRPDHEHYVDFYERHFPLGECLYIYCIRNFKDNYLSISSLWPHKSIEKVAEEYRRSVEAYLRYKDELGSRLTVFNLDHYKTAGRQYLAEEVLKPLGFTVEQRGYDSALGVKAKNVTGSGKAKRRMCLTESEAEFLDKNEDLKELPRVFWR